ncbi:hypothetical protein PO124_33295 [Bacillus licheniformis]|nr:hypothetical protein [Bacillus licheniformis]
MQDHKVKQTIDKSSIIYGHRSRNESKIDDWFNHEWDAAIKAARLLVLFGRTAGEI